MKHKVKYTVYYEGEFTVDAESRYHEILDKTMRMKMNDWSARARFSEIGFQYRIDSVVPIVGDVDYTEINEFVREFSNSKEFLQARVDWRGGWCSEDSLWFALVVAHTFKRLGQVSSSDELVSLMDWDSYAEESFNNAFLVWTLLEQNEKKLSEILCYESGDHD